MDEGRSVELDVDEGIATITLRNPGARNAISPRMAAELGETIDLIEADDSIGVAIIRGADGTFCSGADTRGWDPTLPQAGDVAFKRAGAVYKTVRRLGGMAVPVIAAARGAVVGAGLNLLLAADLRIVATDARLLAGFVKIGLHPGGGFFSLLASAAGKEATAGIGIFGEELSGKQAAVRGLAWEAVPDGRVEGRARELAREAAGDPELARAAIGSMRREIGPPMLPWDVAIEATRGVQMWSQHRRLGQDDAG